MAQCILAYDGKKKMFVQVLYYSFFGKPVIC